MRRPRTPVPPDHVMRMAIEQARSLEAAAFRLGMLSSTLQRNAQRMGVRSLHRIREGLPDEGTLILEMMWCETFRDVAEKYGVEEHAIRNEAKRLGVTAPTKRSVYGLTRPVMPPFRARA